MLRVFLPPNLAAAAARDAIPIKLEIDLSARPADALLAGLALIQSWCGTPKPPPFLQLTTARLRQLLAHLTGQPVFFWINQPATPILWVGPLLRGVSEHLQKPETQKPEPQKSAAQDRPLQNRKSKIENPPTPLLVDGSENYLAISLPSRESISYNTLAELLKTNGFVLEPANRKWWLRNRHKVLNFLATHGDALRDDYHAEFTPNFEKNTTRITRTEIICDAISTGQGSYNLTVGLRAGNVTGDQLQAATASNQAYIEDATGIYLVPPAQLAKLSAAQRALAGDNNPAGIATRRTHRIPAAALVEAESILEEIAPHFQPPAAWRQRSEALRTLSKLAPAPLPPELETLLRPYQRLGIAWLWHLHKNNLGGVLADEMGLGKTIQALALLCAAKQRSDKEQVTSAKKSESTVTLVVCPASLVENWRREAVRFAPALRVFVHHGNQRLADVTALANYDLVITSYGTLARDRDIFTETELAILIADEAQHLKNRRTQNARTLRALRARSRFLLTGTPLENSLDDLRSLFEILMPGYLAPVPTGVRGDERAWHDERLRARTAPYILRRTKQSVAPELPEKIEQIIYCEFEAAQTAIYRNIQENTERSLIDLEASGASENALRLATLTQLLRLRQVCCDPRLLPQTDTKIDATQPFAASAKLDAFREILSEAIDDGHRILVFSQFTKLLALVREELEAQQITFAYLDGSMPVRARQAEVDRFNTSSDIPVFLISLKAGGTGLNLTAADTVIHMDPWWNPAVEAQATDRAHRIGQKRIVTSYKLICSGTVEEKVLQLQDSKRALLADVFEASDATTGKLTITDLKSLLT